MVKIRFLGVRWIRIYQTANLPTVGNPPTELALSVTTPGNAITWQAPSRGARLIIVDILQGPQWLPGFFGLSRPVCEVIARVRRLSFRLALGWLSIAFCGFQPATKQLRRPFDETVISTKGATLQSRRRDSPAKVCRDELPTHVAHRLVPILVRWATYPFLCRPAIQYIY